MVPRSAITGEAGLILRTPTSVLFVIPWGGHWIIGTTDTDWQLDRSHPAASARDIRYLLDQVNTVLDRPLTTDDIEGVYAGLRPLLSGEADSTSKLSREHAVVEPMLGPAAGGGRQVHDVPGDGGGRDRPGGAPARRADPPPSRTDQLPLLGADGYAAAWRDRLDTARRHGVTAGVVEHLLERYGTLTVHLLAMIAADPDAGHAADRRAGIPGRRGGVRGPGRGRAAPRRRAHPAHPDLDRDAAPRRRDRPSTPPR